VATWQSTPPAPARSGRRGKYDWERITRDLKDRPGEWLLIDEEASRSLATAIRNRKMTALQDPDWVFKVRTTNNSIQTGTAQVWMSAERSAE
jgi:hypothetical protein